MSLVESKLLQSKQLIFCSVPWKLRTCTKRFQCLCAVVLPFWTRVAKPRGNGSNTRTSDFAKRNRVSVQKTSMPALRKILKMIVLLSYSVYRWFYVSEPAPNAATGYFFSIQTVRRACISLTFQTRNLVPLQFRGSFLILTDWALFKARDWTQPCNFHNQKRVRKDLKLLTLLGKTLIAFAEQTGKFMSSQYHHLQ